MPALSPVVKLVFPDHYHCPPGITLDERTNGGVNVTL